MRRAVAAGLPGSTAAAVIESGTRAEQRVSRGTLDRLGMLGGSPANGPVLAVVGRTVALGDLLRAEPEHRSAAEEASAHA